ncbi:MAG TPA: hypothetical protein VKU85_17250 [bacterium]|nr:hypothetical protein [bacterium]
MTAPDRKLSPRIAYLVFLVILATLTVIVAEAFCRHRYWQDVALVRDPDHRLSPDHPEVNPDGIRCERESDAFPPEDLNVVILGDSFVYGLKQYPELSFPRVYEELVRAEHPACRINVANFGWVSSSPFLSRRLLEDIGEKYSPDVVFLAVDMTDFHDDLLYRNLIERPTLAYRALAVVPGIVVFVKKKLEDLGHVGWCRRLHERMFRLPVDRFFIVNEPLTDTARWHEPLLANVDSLASHVTDRLAARFVVLVLPRSFQYSRRESPRNWERDSYETLGPHSLEPFVLFEELARRAPYDVVSLLPAFREAEAFPLSFYDDPHWTEKGCRFVAERVQGISRELGLFECGDIPSTPPAGSAD